MLIKYLLSYLVMNILYNFIYGVTEIAHQHSDFISDLR